MVITLYSLTACCIVFSLAASQNNANEEQRKITTLNLSREAVVGIFNGSVSFWNDPLITRENSYFINQQLPAERIRVVVRRDTSGTTSIVTSALSRFSPKWANTYGTFSLSSRWNRSVVSYYGVQNRGLAGIIMSFPYTIGYVSVADVVDMGLSYARLKNRAGYYVDARDVQSLQSSMDDYVQQFDEHLVADIGDGPGIGSYPIVGLTYMVVNENQPQPNCDAAEEFLRYADWFVNDEFAHDLCVKQHMAPLSRLIAQRVTDQVLRTYRCNGRNMWRQVEERKLQEARSLQTWRLPVYILTPIISVVILGLFGYILLVHHRQNRAVRQNLFIVPNQNIRFLGWQLSRRKLRRSSQSLSANSASSISLGTLRLSKTTTAASSYFSSSARELHQHYQSKQRVSAVLIRSSEDGGCGDEVELTKVAVENHPRPLGDITTLSYTTRRLLFTLRDRVQHVNVQRFLGLVSFFENDESEPNRDNMGHCLVRDACSKGSMQALIHSSKYEMDNVVKFSLATDIAAGMEYLHRDQNFVHGQLRTWNCLITSRWQVNISDWEWHQLKDSELRQLSAFDDEKNAELQWATSLPYDGRWIAPEILAQWLVPDKDVHNPSAKHSLLHFSLMHSTKSGDVYSFAIILYEIFEREEPYASYVQTDQRLMDEIVYNHLRPKWNMSSESVMNNAIAEIRSMTEHMWQTSSSSPLEQRPNFQTLHRRLRQINPGGKKSMVDLMMKALDEYAASLEDRVLERTSELQQVSSNMTELLHRMVPPSIAEKLAKGESVLPEGYDSVTIYFSDIVGFTAICATSTPLQIVHLLNQLYTMFDETIDSFDVFKVETIGDSYMLISGLPNRNGIDHAGHIATVALKLLAIVMEFRIPHKPETLLQIRSGVHSGSVVAGVVGVKMPRFCLFGDTVNTAARMESSSLPMRIQISSDTNTLLSKQLDSKFNVQSRGKIEIKGKGEMFTFWLLGRPDMDLVLPAYDTNVDEVEKQKLILCGQYK